MREAEPQATFCVMPNAGWPERANGRIIYSDNPQYFANYAQAFKQAGASIIGGCCGTTPQHIAAARDALALNQHSETTIDSIQPLRSPDPSIHTSQEPTQLANKLRDGHFVISVEMNPPHGFSTHKLLAGARMLVDSGADLINLPDSPMSRMRMSPWAACQLIQSEVGVETILHFPTRGRNLLRVQSDLLAAHALDVRNIFVVMGDPTSIGDYPEATDSYDVVPSGLIHLINQGFNTGVDHAGTEIEDATCFFVGCALNLAAKDLQRETRILNRKIKAGAHFALTQPLYDPDLLHRFQAEYHHNYGDLEIPILIGILPIFNSRHASFLHHEVPGIYIPQSIRDQIAAAKGDAPGEGVRIAIDTLKTVAPHVHGTYLMSAFGRYDLVAEVIEQIREHPPLNDLC
jgi:homocysteine S-methyltransferase